MYFGRERVEAGPSCLHELATFLKYHMPLTTKKKDLLNLEKIEIFGVNMS